MGVIGGGIGVLATATAAVAATASMLVAAAIVVVAGTDAISVVPVVKSPALLFKSTSMESSGEAFKPPVCCCCCCSLFGVVVNPSSLYFLSTPLRTCFSVGSCIFLIASASVLVSSTRTTFNAFARVFRFVFAFGNASALAFLLSDWSFFGGAVVCVACFCVSGVFF
jgi:hypothetical protein